ncbi:MAG TPA: DUF6356 family protein [Rickettsiales bacterium]|nr:DUF6356 family protein [Rickettsiales bacterium]
MRQPIVYSRKALLFAGAVKKAFVKHPADLGEGYLQHFAFAAETSLDLIGAGCALMTHAFFPFLFPRTASTKVKRIYGAMQERSARSGMLEKMLPNNILPFRKPSAADGIARVGVVGGGFSGALAIANLVRRAHSPMVIEWFDEGNTLACGVAYGTEDAVHLLNVRANRMGAFPEAPDGFYQWLHTAEGKKCSAELCPGKEWTPHSFVPRALYGAYLKFLTEEAFRLARNKGIDIRVVQAQVMDVRLYDPQTQQLLLCSSKGGIMRETLVDALVLATGNLPPRSFGNQIDVARCVDDVWRPSADSIFPRNVNQLSADSEVVIVGTGLTMIDTVQTLRARGFKGTVTAISRHGKLPQAHTDDAHVSPYPAWEWTQTPDEAPQTALGLLRAFRQQLRKAEAEGYDWRSVVDSLRPVTAHLWRRLATGEKRKCVRHLLTLWNTHRHRVAPQIYADIKAMLASGTLKIVSGHIYYIGTDEMGVTVAYRKRGANRVETIRAALVINCSGPQYDIAASGHTLLKNMRDRGLVTVGPLRCGIEINSTGGAAGLAGQAVFPIGSLLVGELLECTAVPELRQRAAEIAQILADKFAPAAIIAGREKEYHHAG